MNESICLIKTFFFQKNASDSVELSSESGSVNADAAEEMMLDHENNDYVNPRGVRFTPHKQPKEGKSTKDEHF